jgi:hypothetical protein
MTDSAVVDSALVDAALYQIDVCHTLKHAALDGRSAHTQYKETI